MLPTSLACPPFLGWRPRAWLFIVIKPRYWFITRMADTDGAPLTLRTLVSRPFPRERPSALISESHYQRPCILTT